MNSSSSNLPSMNLNTLVELLSSFNNNNICKTGNDSIMLPYP